MNAITARFERLRPVIILALNTGMRQGEITSLAWSDIDWERNLVNVIDTKNGDDRIVPMNPVMKDLLLKL